MKDDFVMDSQSRMQTLLDSRKPGYSLEQPFYNDADFHALDMQLI